LIAVAALVLLFVVAFVTVVPYAVRYGVETVASRELGRKVTVRSVSANPFLLRVAFNGLVIAEAAPEQGNFVAVDRIAVNLSSASLAYLAPVLDALEVQGAKLQVVRLDEHHFNFTDIVERLRARPSDPNKASEPARFALYNIEVKGSRVEFSDRMLGSKHEIADLAIGVPFISNLPTHVEVKVQPALSARLNGTPLEVRGETQPFHETLESSVQLKLDGLDIPTYLGFSPVRLDFALPKGKLDTDLRIVFRGAVAARDGQPARPQELLVSGQVGLRQIDLQAPRAAAQPLLRFDQLQLRLGEVAPFGQRIVIDDVSLDAPETWVAFGRDGTLNWQRFAQGAVERKPDPKAAPASGAAGKPWQLTVKNAAVRAGIVHFSDERLGKFTQELQNIEASAQNISTVEGAAPGRVQVKAGIAPQGTVGLSGAIALAPLKGELDYAADDVQLRMAARYLTRVIDGTLDGSTMVRGKLMVAKTGDALQLALRELNLEGKQITLRGPQGSGAQLDIARLALQGGELDLTGRKFTAASLTIDTPRVGVKRLQDGSIGWQQLAKAGIAEGEAPAPAKDTAQAQPDWDVTLAALELRNGTVNWDDASVSPPARISLSALGGTVRNVTAAGTTPMQISLRGRSSGVTRGTLAVDGNARVRPLQTDLRIDLRNLDLAPARSYVTEHLNAEFLRGEVTSRSRVQLATQASGPMRVRLDGGLRVANLQLLNPDGDDDLLRWQALDIDKIALRLGEGPADVELGTIALSDFFARVIVSAEGRLNLADVLRKEGEPAAAAAAVAKDKAKPEPAQVAATPPQADGNASQKAASAASAPAAPATAAPARPRIRIERIELTRGNVNFTDNFIRPNYTANLTDITGSVSTLASDATEPATLQLTGSVDREAPVTIEGRLNPLAPKLFLDIKGSTKGVDLPRFTPYSAKYAGYPIIKGKLSMDVSYRIENDQLKANNHLFLDQLTFGERVESPTATKLPVLLAVSLLKNTRGEIDINLPIAGSLDDPKFSVGGIIVQVIVNVLTKIVTSPFALLASAFGSEAELGFVDFGAGSAALGKDQVQRLDTLAKALNDRPGLRLDIIGRADTAADTAGLKRTQLDARMRAAKVRQQVRAGGASAAPESVTVEPAERAALLAAVYGDDRVVKKPRNAIGIPRTLPAPEMEQLLLDAIVVTSSELRVLANARAAAVRDHLEQQGKVPRERLFLVEPKIDAPNEANAKGAPTRVDFSLK
jgi:hypothetical protein